MLTFETTLRQPPVIDGNLQEFSRDPVTCMRRVQTACGNMAVLREGDQQLIFAFGPEYNRQLLTQPDLFHSRFFAIRGPRDSAQRRLTSGLLSMNGEEHSRNRRLVKGAFDKRVIPGHVQTVRQLTGDMLFHWEAGQTRDISEEMTRLMLRITASMLFGSEHFELACETASMMEHWVQLNHELGTAAFVARDEFYPRYQQLLSFAEKLEDRIRDMIHECEDRGADGDNALAMLIQAGRAGQAITEDQLIGQAALLFAAAHMTTAHTLTWTLFLLSQHPAIVRELEAEIHAERAASSFDAEALTGHVAELGGANDTLLERVIRESMRILPASSYSQRVAQKTTQLGRYEIPSGAVVIFSQFMTHRLESLYPQANVFHPDRWLSIRPGPYEYLPFGGGSRLCLGAPLATAILRTVLPMILSRFRLQLEPWSEVTGLVVSTMLSPVTGLRMRLLTAGTPVTCGPVRGNIHSLVSLPGMERPQRKAA